MVRLHKSDADADGDREDGYGFDFGPVSVDYKSETLVSDLPWLMTVGGLFLMVGESIWDDWTYQSGEWDYDQ